MKLGRELEEKRVPARKPVVAVTPKRAAPVATPASATIGRPVVAGGGGKKGFDSEGVMQKGGTREALEEAYASL
jgi:hypothetical protein